MNAIVAVDSNWAIGKDNQLLLHLPGDLQYFKEKTSGKVVVMGRTTLGTLPSGKPLKNRTNLVLSGNPDFQPDCPVFRTIEELLSYLKGFDPEDIFVIGGEMVYRQLLPLCDRVYVTKIEEAFQADKYFPNLDKMEEWKLIGQEAPRCENGVTYRFTVYERVKTINA